MEQRLLLAAAAAGLVTGILALTGHVVTTVLHGVGGLGALALVAVVANRVRNRRTTLLLVVMGAASVTGLIWTLVDANEVVVVSHVLIGVFASAGAVLLAAS